MIAIMVPAYLSGGQYVVYGAGPILLADVQVSEMQDIVSAHPTVFGGLAGDPNSQMVTIYLAQNVGSPEQSAALKALASIRTPADPKSVAKPKHWSVRFVNQGPSLAILESVRHEVTTQEPWRSEVGSSVSASYIDPVHHAVVLGLTAPPPAAVTSALAQTFGAHLIVTHRERMRNLVSRGIDSQPYWGGDGLLGEGVGCTSAFEAYDFVGGTKHYGWLTAGHCFTTIGDNIYNGYVDSSNNPHFGAFIGQLSLRSYANGQPDAEFLDSTAIGVSNQDEEYLDWATHGSLVNDQGTSFVGLGVCFDGEPTVYYTGYMNCSGVVLSTDFCAI
ncbi:MAG TPA: hypothetical protein VNH18_00530, partial [Bryobacteraceae bacterium]|nr:hypothetical protein [Bryobacteraceae bacterium]